MTISSNDKIEECQKCCNRNHTKSLNLHIQTIFPFTLTVSAIHAASPHRKSVIVNFYVLPTDSSV